VLQVRLAGRQLDAQQNQRGQSNDQC
jgi:hypothetical protein